MKSLFLIGLLVGTLIFLWALLSPLFGKIGRLFVQNKEKVKENIINSEEDFWNE
ncbi:hypothetical protein [Listeria fleischmannii]|uniref:hypothetical protein n=1 Tax=Listeria fleischmannii TaxID=1069827 RepID=UPI0004BB5404|nr:hypothetical protein [Listeria fleischmannii]